MPGCLPFCLSLYVSVFVCVSLSSSLFLSSSMSLCLPASLYIFFCVSMSSSLSSSLSISSSVTLSLPLCHFLSDRGLSRCPCLFLCLSVFLSLFLCLSILLSVFLSVFLSDSVSLPICQALLPDIDYCKWLTRFVTVELRENGGMYCRDPKWGMICPTVCNYSLRLLQKHEFQLWLIIIVAEVESTWVTYAMDHKIWIFS